jgi:sodium/bile acid cotransporter 7
MQVRKHVSLGCRYYIIGIASLLCTFFFAREAVRCEERLTNEGKARKVLEMYEDYKRSSFPEIEDIAPEGALNLLDKGNVLFVDIRSHDEQEVSMLPGAITEKEFRDNPNGSPDHVIISYCTISYRSGLFAKEFQEKGIRILNLKGGLLGWVHEGGVVYDQNKETNLIHVYGKKWDLAPDEYKTMFFKLPFLKY